MHNPGTVPNDERVYNGADIVVVAEIGYQLYQSDSQLQKTLRELPLQDIGGRNSAQRFSYIFNGIPSNWTTNDLRNCIDTIKEGAGWLFMTDVDSSSDPNIYDQWGSDWDAFTQAMALN